MDIPDSILEQLKCTICENYLSHSPMYYNPFVGHICGRHPEQVTLDRFQQQSKYELVAGLFLFPCCYEPFGCSDRFSIDEMAGHEMVCAFKPSTCPVNKCIWRGLNTELASHFQLYHKPIVVVGQTVDIDLVLEKNLKMDMFFMVLGQYFMVHCEFSKYPKTFDCSIQMICKQQELIKNYECEITIKTKDGRHSWPVEKCILQSYSFKYLQQSECHVRLTSMNCVSRSPVNAILSIKFMELDPVESDTDTENEDEDDDDVFLETLKCPICLEYMVPPIHQCVIGHSFCKSCKEKLDKCPTCRYPIGCTRNYSLENVTENVTYNCVYKTEGCTFKTDSVNIRKHQFNCEYKISECILSDVTDCNYVGPHVAMYQHCTEVHPNFVQEGPFFQMIYVPFCANFEVSLMKLHFGVLFKVCYGYNDENVTCSVQCISPVADETTYMYEMQIVDLNGTGYELMSKRMCAKLSDDKDNLRFCTVWHINMVKPLILNSSQLKFSCTISANNN